VSRRLRVAIAAAVVALALPATAYVLPSSAILRLAAKRRADAAAQSGELRGTFSTGATAPTAAVLWVKGGRCRLELVGSPERPYAIVRGGHLASQRGLDRYPGAAALAEGACALLGPATPDALVRSFAGRGVAVQEVTLGRLGARVGYVLGGHAKENRPQAWIDKQLMVPMRLVADVAGARRDVRLLDYPVPAPAAAGERAPPPPVASDLWPRAIEVHHDEALEARFAIDRVGPGAKIPDSLL
jgi:hypothetical protein